MSEDAPGRSVEVNGASLYYEERGNGPPVILIHGGLGSHTQWEDVVPELTSDFRLITPDSRGHGRSSHPGKELSYTAIADDVAGLIGAQGLARPVVGGWSDGGQVVLELGVRHPGAAGALVVGAAYPDFASSGLREAHRALLGAGNAGVRHLGRLEEQLGDAAELIKSAHPGGSARWTELVRQTAPMWLDYAGLRPDELLRIEVPTLVLGGDRDEFVSLDLAVSLYRALPNAELAICPHTEHAGPTRERAAVFASLIRDFVSRHTRT